MEGAVFLSRVSEELSSSSPFITRIGCQQFVAKGYCNLCFVVFVLINLALSEFCGKATELHDKIIDRWRDFIVSRIVDEHYNASRLTYPVISKFA